MINVIKVTVDCISNFKRRKYIIHQKRSWVVNMLGSNFDAFLVSPVAFTATVWVGRTQLVLGRRAVLLDYGYNMTIFRWLHKVWVVTIQLKVLCSRRCGVQPAAASWILMAQTNSIRPLPWGGLSPQTTLETPQGANVPKKPNENICHSFWVKSNVHKI